ncbi:TPA: Gfo/Idh/MocA family oxidoreductase [Yersinia enterocolitica]|uniref:Gfo/Idh/MocA family protein n=1 Tax=Yersinia enterocolitica TaxID=630 RepID=UPI000200B723|nr:Gfo/Idh/MocA family oxidoreductase [Yersinia enterocolitica]ADZ41907.1 hypothetical protein YE105_C1411 [Yersinia enterocolitica subsp. palearctica 105.5R(r)]HDL7391367.1 Gfo/Idh/MocA family oxidoreductase [Yersinia enterocolitica]HDL7442595.1 Gfo/Idh/MocA family oxidoreductase [Yersinia enterocolitica]
MQKVRIGLIGTGYIGRCHAIAYAQVATVFPLKGLPVLEMLAEVTPELAQQRAEEFGFSRSTANWQELVSDPAIDVVDICAPNFLHKEMAEAARAKGVKTLVGFNYMKNPTSQLAREIIANGEIGDIVHFYGTHNEDYLADPQTPLDWHCTKAQAGLGALGDLAAHIVNMAHYLVGDITNVCGDMQTVIKQRPDPKNPSLLREVENEDQASVLVRFANGAMGTIETSRIACGRKMGLTYVVTGTKGTISYSQERMAELQLYRHDEPQSRQGFKTLLTGPLHPDYAAFCISAGHGIGFNDQKTVEIRDLINGITAGDRMWPDFEEGWKVSRVLDAIATSAEELCWINVVEN